MCFFFFKQKTAYEMRISDWSSDVCSSDLDRDKYVAAVHLIQRPGQPRLVIIRLLDVHRLADDLGSVFPEVRDGVLDAILRPGGDGQVATFAGKNFGRGHSDAARRADDDRLFSLEPQIHPSSPQPCLARSLAADPAASGAG